MAARLPPIRSLDPTQAPLAPESPVQLPPILEPSANKPTLPSLRSLNLLNHHHPGTPPTPKPDELKLPALAPRTAMQPEALPPLRSLNLFNQNLAQAPPTAGPSQAPDRLPVFAPSEAAHSRPDSELVPHPNGREVPTRAPLIHEFTFKTSDGVTAPAPNLLQALDEPIANWGRRFCQQDIAALVRGLAPAQQLQLVIRWPGCPGGTRTVRLTRDGRVVGRAELYRNVAAAYQSYFRELKMMGHNSTDPAWSLLSPQEHLERLRLLKLWHLGGDRFQAEVEF